MLRVDRTFTFAQLKKEYRRLSLELHPDRNKLVSAEEDFRQVKHAFDVLSTAELRQAYDLYGERGVNIATQSVLDLKHILIHLIVSYGSSLFLAFMITFSDPGDALEISCFGLSGNF